MPFDLLPHFTDAAKSPLALLAYILAIAAWVTATFLRKRLEGKATKILKLYKNDQAKLEALRSIKGAPRLGPIEDVDKIIEVLKLRDRQNARTLFLVGFVVVVLGILAAYGMKLGSQERGTGEITDLSETRSELLKQYEETEREIKKLVRPAAPNPDPEYVAKLHALIKRNRAIAARVGEQDSWGEVATLIEIRLPGTLQDLGYPVPEK